MANYCSKSTLVARLLKWVIGSERPIGCPAPFTEELVGSHDKGTQWNAFLSCNRLDAEGMVLTQIIQQIRLFLMPPMIAAASGQEFEKTWPTEGPWVAERGCSRIVISQAITCGRLVVPAANVHPFCHKQHEFRMTPRPSN
jgi:hypothetical protein